MSAVSVGLRAQAGVVLSCILLWRVTFTLVSFPAGIDSAPANLESTSFALAHGLDLYLTRVQPSNTFDLLPEDFPFALLIAITVTMIGASVALKYMGEKTSVKQKWA